MEPKSTAPVPLAERPPELVVTKRSVRKKLLAILAGVLLLIIVCVLSIIGLYQLQLRAVNSHDTSRERITIELGTSPDSIASLLKQKKLIRSETAFDIYIRLHSVRNQLQAGTYSLSPSESTKDIITHLVSGKTDTFTITFFPGATLTDNTATSENKKIDVTHVLLRAGYKEDEIKTALNATYDDPSYSGLFAGKPASTSLEGYVYGETYQVNSGASVQEILAKTFAEYYTEIQQHNIEAGLQQQGLNLYQGITLASIVQREIGSSDTSTASTDQREVAQVFYSRLAQDMPLGSDVTAYYGADTIGAAHSVAVDTPYNTRIHTGLPPGPIAVPSIGALEAVANPASTDYLYFLSGDDGKTYFARTNDEHEQNITDHCKILCQVP